jgi:hypothetical protein
MRYAGIREWRAAEEAVVAYLKVKNSKFIRFHSLDSNEDIRTTAKLRLLGAQQYCSITILTPSFC